MTGLPAVREAAAAELEGWDDRTVAVRGGDVQQSRAWAEHRRRTGWRVHFLVGDDGGAALALGRPWRLLGGGRLYVPKGPAAGGATPEQLADRLAAIAGWARAAGYDAVLSDAEVPAATGYRDLLAARGFRPVEEVGPSRHRVATPIVPGVGEQDLLSLIDRTTRQRFRAAERRGARVVRYDTCAGGDPGPGFEAPAPAELPPAAAAAFDRFHGLLADTGERRGFAIGPRESATAWWRAALGAGHLVLLEARAADDTYLGAAIFLRNGERLTYAHSGDVVGLRHEHPGAVHLLLWRALQLAQREGRAELDLGGVDVAGARHEPRPGEPMFGLYEFKRAFGGRWVELAGAHERSLRPWRLAAGTLLGRAGRVARRAASRTSRTGRGRP